VSATTDPQDILIVTGPSGAGRSTAINALEDFGFEAIDNLPMGLLPRFLSGPSEGRPLAIGVDARTRGFSAGALWVLIEELNRDAGLAVSLVYIDARVEVLVRRFSETRRRHPLTAAPSLLAGIESEIEMLAPLRSRAEVLIDTSDMAPQDLRAELARHFSRETAPGLSVSVQSFSYKRGLPRGIDMVMDCRFLRNPHWDPALRPLTGLNDAVAAYVRGDTAYAPFIDQLVGMMVLLLPAYKAEGKSYFSLGLGCTGGQHRSVAVAEALANRLAQEGWQVSIRHRELERQGNESPARAVGLS
jgi:UPF0042 nucleotide-binding protein